MHDRVWQVPQEQFVIAWSQAESLDEVTRRIMELVGGPVPRWAIRARAMTLRKQGVKLKQLRPSAA